MEEKNIMGLIVIITASIGLFVLLMMAPFVNSNLDFMDSSGMMHSDSYSDYDDCSVMHYGSFEECEVNHEECEEEFHEYYHEHEQNLDCPMD